MIQTIDGMELEEELKITINIGTMLRSGKKIHHIRIYDFEKEIAITRALWNLDQTRLDIPDTIKNEIVSILETAESIK